MGAFGLVVQGLDVGATTEGCGCGCSCIRSGDVGVNLTRVSDRWTSSWLPQKGVKTAMMGAIGFSDAAAAVPGILCSLQCRSGEWHKVLRRASTSTCHGDIIPLLP